MTMNTGMESLRLVLVGMLVWGSFGCDSKAKSQAQAAALGADSGLTGGAPAENAARERADGAQTANQRNESLLEPGDELPAIKALAHTGQVLDFAELSGRPVVVYFYPRDDSPGCTLEAQGIRDRWHELRQTHALVLGVSTDDNASHRAFASKYELPFLLVADPDHAVAQAFGVPVAAGRARRTTFVFDAEGELVKVFPEVEPRDSAEQILAELRKLE